MKMNECSFVYAITAAAQALAQGRSTDEVNILSAYFTQLGDTLATIAALKAESANNQPNS